MLSLKLNFFLNIFTVAVNRFSFLTSSICSQDKQNTGQHAYANFETEFFLNISTIKGHIFS